MVQIFVSLLHVFVYELLSFPELFAIGLNLSFFIYRHGHDSHYNNSYIFLYIQVTYRFCCVYELAHSFFSFDLLDTIQNIGKYCLLFSDFAKLNSTQYLNNNWQIFTFLSPPHPQKITVCHKDGYMIDAAITVYCFH